MSFFGHNIITDTNGSHAIKDIIKWSRLGEDGGANPMGPIDGWGKSISAYIYSPAGSGHVKFAYYGTEEIIGYGTEEKIPPAGWSWVTCNFITSPFLPALIVGGTYVLAAWSDTTGMLVAKAPGAGTILFDNHTYNGWPEQLAEDDVDIMNEIIAYCTYDEVAASQNMTIAGNLTFI